MSGSASDIGSPPLRWSELNRISVDVNGLRSDIDAVRDRMTNVESRVVELSGSIEVLRQSLMALSARWLPTLQKQLDDSLYETKKIHESLESNSQNPTSVVINIVAPSVVDDGWIRWVITLIFLMAMVLWMYKEPLWFEGPIFRTLPSQ